MRDRMKVTSNDILNIAHAMNELGSIKTPNGYCVSKMYFDNLLNVMSCAIECYRTQLIEKDEEK